MDKSISRNDTHNNTDGRRRTHMDARNLVDFGDLNQTARAEQWLESMIRQSRNQVHTAHAKLTPELAANLISRNDDNRVLKSYRISTYAADMLAGRWEFNGEPIIVSSEGTMNDGQHRCHAVIESGITIDAVFVFGVTRESRLTTDQGSQKTVGDYLAMEGVKNSNNLAAAAAAIMGIERFRKFISGANNLMPSKSEIRERVMCDPDIETSFRFVRQPGANRVAPGTLLTVIHYMASQIDRADADLFLAKLIAGAELKERDPILVLREKLKDKSLRLNNNERMKAMIMGWNHFRRGLGGVRSLTHMIKKGEKLPELR